MPGAKLLHPKATSIPVRECSRPLLGKPGYLSGYSVLDPHTECTAVVAVVVIIDRQNQPAIRVGRIDQLITYQKRRADLTVGRTNIANQRPGASGRYRLCAHDRSEAADASAFRSDTADAPSRDDGAAGVESYLIAGAQIDAGIGPARNSGYFNCHFARRAVAPVISG